MTPFVDTTAPVFFTCICHSSLINAVEACAMKIRGVGNIKVSRWDNKRNNKTHLGKQTSVSTQHATLGYKA